MSRWLHGWRWWMVQFSIGATVFGAVIMNNLN